MGVFDHFSKTRDYLVCVDSDGCILNTMDLKHKECFCPATVNVWGLQNVSNYVREAAEFVNLYSASRGMNRFPSLVRTIDLTFERPEVLETGVQKPDLGPLRAWIGQTDVLSVPGLEEALAAHPNEVLARALCWSREVDDNIARIVHGVLPFPHVMEALSVLGTFADIIVVSATPQEALTRELYSCGLDVLVSVIAGQEIGTKAQIIAKAMRFGYAPENVLKIGDAPGDLKAAKQNGVLFYPIVAREEAKSWKALEDEVHKRFHSRTYAGQSMEDAVARFLSRLPETPPWLA